MKIDNHGPAWRRPFWVRLWMKRIHGRAQAVFFTWFSLIGAVGLLIYGFWDYRAWFFCALFLNGAFWLTLATWWVDKYDHWD